MPHSEELSAAAPERMATPLRGSPPLAPDDGEGSSSGGGALHVNANSYVQSQVCKFKVGGCLAKLFTLLPAETLTLFSFFWKSRLHTHALMYNKKMKLVACTSA